MYDSEKYQSAFRNATPEMRDFLSSETIPNCVSSVVSDKKLDESHYRDLVRLCARHTLAVLTKDEVLGKMNELKIPESESVFDLLMACVKVKLPQVMSVGSAENVTVTPVSNPPTPQNTPPTPPPPGMRTLPNDVKKVANSEATYTSSQEALLNESRPKPQSSIPKPN